MQLTKTEMIIDTSPRFPVPTLTLRCVLGGGTFARQPAVSCASPSTWHVRFQASLASEELESPDRATVEVALPTELAWYLNVRRELVELVREVRPPWPVGCFAVVKYGGDLFQVRPFAHIRLRRGAGSLIATLTIRDRKTCGLRLWGEHKMPRSPLRHTLNIDVSRLGRLSDAVWAEPFPNCARSVICLTDHPDWDSVPKATALYNLFAAHDVRITKAVFPSADAGWDYGPGLDSPEYAAVIDRWFETGHEIAFHGLGSGIHPPAQSDECLRRIDRLDPYEPRTWIDHSCGDYGFGKAASLPSGADLLQTLSAKGVQNFWSYTDLWQNPATHLHSWRPRTVHSAFGDSLELVWRRGSLGPLQLAYLGSIPVKNLTGDTQYRRVFKQPWSLSQWAGLGTNYRILREIDRGPLCLYELSGDFFLRNPSGIMVFDTVLLNHLALQMRPSNIESLARDNGILIGHTYLAATHKKGGRNCFRVDREAQFVDGFLEDVEHISALQKSGQTVTLPLRDLRVALARHAMSSLIRTAEGWEAHGELMVASHTPYQIAGGKMAEDRTGIFTAPISSTALLVNP